MFVEEFHEAWSMFTEHTEHGQRAVGGDANAKQAVEIAVPKAGAKRVKDSADGNTTSSSSKNGNTLGQDGTAKPGGDGGNDEDGRKGKKPKVTTSNANAIAKAQMTKKAYQATVAAANIAPTGCRGSRIQQRWQWRRLDWQGRR